MSMVANDRQQIIKEIAHTALDRMRKEHLDGVMKEHSRQELIDKKMQEISERMNKLDARMQSISHIFSDGFNFKMSDLVEINDAHVEGNAVRVYVDTRNDGKLFYIDEDSKTHPYTKYEPGVFKQTGDTIFMQFGETLYEMKHIPGADPKIDRPTVRLEVSHINDNMPKLPCYMHQYNLSGSSIGYCVAIRLEPMEYPFTSVYKINGREYTIESYVKIVFKEIFYDGRISESESRSNFFNYRFIPAEKEEVLEHLKLSLTGTIDAARKNLKLARQHLNDSKRRLRLLSKTLTTNSRLLNIEDSASETKKKSKTSKRK